MHRGFRGLAAALAVLAVLALPMSALAVTASKAADSVSAWDEENPQDLSGSNLYAQSAVLVDARTGDVLFSKNADAQLNPASITKILTALLVLEKCDLDEQVTATLSQMGEYEAVWLPLQNGETMVVKDMLYGMMLRSYNDVAAALAVHVGGSLTGFAEMMNRKAQELGCTDSNFVVPHGLTTANHYTTANDMAKIMRAAMQNETFRNILATTEYVIPPSNKREDSVTATNGNKMLPDSGSDYAYADMLGGKTGYTMAALHTYAAAAQRDGVNLICVILGTNGPESMAARGDTKWLDAEKLFEYGFSQYERLDVAALYAQSPIECEVEGCVEGDTGVLRLELGDTGALSGMIVKKSERSAAEESFQSSVSVSYLSDRVAPIEKGQKIGEMTYTYGSNGSVTVDLVASRSVLQAVAASAAMTYEEPLDGATVPPTLTGIATGVEGSPVRYLALLLIIPVLILLGLIVSMVVDVTRRRKRLRARIQRSRSY